MIETTCMTRKIYVLIRIGTPMLAFIINVSNNNFKIRHCLVTTTISFYNGILVPVRTSFGLRRRGGKMYNVLT